VPASLQGEARSRDPDASTGGTWEALRVLSRAGYHPAAMPKVKVARFLAAHMNPVRSAREVDGLRGQMLSKLQL